MLSYKVLSFARERLKGDKALFCTSNKLGNFPENASFKTALYETKDYIGMYNFDAHIDVFYARYWFGTPNWMFC